MTRQNNLFRTVSVKTLVQRLWQGAALALVLLLVFLTAAGVLTDGVWVLLPMLTVSVGGACGGAFFYLANLLAAHYGWNRILVNLLCAVVYGVGLWMSLIAALSVVGLWD